MLAPSPSAAHLNLPSTLTHIMSNSIVGEVYQHVILDVIANSRNDFEENGVEEATLQELQSLWQSKLVATNVASFPWAQAPVAPFSLGQLFDPVNGIKPEALEAAAVAAAASGASPVLGNIAAIRAAQQMDAFVQQQQQQQQQASRTSAPSYYTSTPSSLSVHRTPSAAPQNNAAAAAAAAAAAQSNVNMANGMVTYPSYSASALQLPGQNSLASTGAFSNSSSLPAQADSNNVFNGLLLPGQDSPKPPSQQTFPNLPPPSPDTKPVPPAYTTPASGARDESASKQQQPAAVGSDGKSSSADEPSSTHIPQTDGPSVEAEEEEEAVVEPTAAQKADAEIYSILAKNRVLQIDGTADDEDDADGKGGAASDTPSDEAINSDLDDPDSDDAPETEEGSDIGQAIVLCLYDKVNRNKNKWKCVLKDGIVGVNGKDYLFFKANGEFEWI
ncbi:transcription factor TFIIA complex large subunit [Schizosaccharomyces japonicus yFS275]|uniref:Transcription initiation factor IIA large subunit n=1 Tax=Schizosaccharomyces japonicus (strain yFS275 / FY16936) TaxID=402676 RepID=B6JYP5_SCHJY|nr:transcription factor TFIIA complex large subunit [Schizosaccharomyces japonicus yFS275]EEB06663.2 transcription factor TFIIA complex large subunit [Schizosaccharomyces japonicus yFS275]